MSVKGRTAYLTKSGVYRKDAALNTGTEETEVTRLSALFRPGGLSSWDPPGA